MADHVHILMTLPADKSIADMMRLVKTNSSRWVRETLSHPKTFSWQTGYSAFSVSQSALQRVSKYIAEQEKHHAKLSFQDEYRELLTLHGLPFDEKYVWG
jgi:REP element-mobilizing transposase RayT